MNVVVPATRPQLGPRAARALLRLLVAEKTIARDGGAPGDHSDDAGHDRRSFADGDSRCSV